MRRSVSSLVGVVAAMALVGGLFVEPGFPAAAEEPEVGSPGEAELLQLPLESDESPAEVLPAPSTPDSMQPENPEAAEQEALTEEEVLASLTPDKSEEVKAPIRESDLPSDSLISKRDAFSDTYDLGEGMHISRTSPEQINVRQDGEWKEIQTDVQGVGFWSFLGIGGGEVPVHPLAPQFAETASDDGVLRVTHEGHEVAYTLQGAAGSKLQRNLGLGDKDEVSYGDVFPATDLIYQVQNSGVEQLFRLDKAPAADGRTSWTWQVDSGGLALSKTEDGVIEFRDKDDRVC
ncbi:hypothetical protein J7E29_03900 [Streptomyces sp. ISL-90]|nr:hypothetical protein [Streptomyces sp. ISL-90]